MACLSGKGHGKKKCQLYNEDDEDDNKYIDNRNYGDNNIDEKDDNQYNNTILLIFFWLTFLDAKKLN